MPTPDKPPMTRAVVLRGIGFIAAIALGALAAWLVVTGNDQRTLRIGMLVGLWGLVLGAYSMFGARRGMGVEADDDPGRQIALREARQLERQDDADARRDWESRLERLISREVSTAVGRETATLRNEIAHLRQELLDKVGGQLRLERIETTRVIGSDLEALQHEVRQLKDANGGSNGPDVRELLAASNDPRLAVRPIVEAARIRPVSRSTAEVEADLQPAVTEATDAGSDASNARPVPPAPPVVPVPVPQMAAQAPPPPVQPPAPPAPPATPVQPAPAPQPPVSDAAARVHQAPTPATPATQPPAPQPPTQPPAPQPPAPDAAEAPKAGDPFAGLPRLSPFVDLAPASGNGNGNGNGNGHDSGNGNGAKSGYTGRRRRAAEDDDEQPEPETTTKHSRSGRGRRRSDDAGNAGSAGNPDGDGRDDLLARLLSRQSPER